MNISLCITTHNRLNFLIESFQHVLKDDRVSEIIISDDASDIEIFKKLKLTVDTLPEKVKLHRNISNQGVYRNKYTSVSLAKNEWVIVFDSDNVIDSGYIDTLYKYLPWDLKILYNPDFGKTEFDWSAFGGKIITKENVASFLKQHKFDSLINAMNCFVNRDEYLKTFDDTVEPIAADSIYKNYLWLNAGNRIFVVPGLRYEHRIHKGSHYVNNVSRSNEFFYKVNNLLKTMR